ncbi:Carbonyl reductase [NADPH] 1 [Smittium culicis]|uniref:Carbonyl reductase [NADPH] 1 n=1 Tax=Smittium culicis TaxID=133412 RepID=A0A1R1YTE7_9FUNG|nr:Carbonyl reductase [NADPH] 1 [Smittium culicis]
MTTSAFKKNALTIITGSNKGIGFGIVKQLLSSYTSPTTILMTSRNEELGHAALEDAKRHLPSTNNNVTLQYHQLDIVDSESVSSFKKFLIDTYGSSCIDALINNAGFLVKKTELELETTKKIIEINYFGTVKVTEALLPLMNQNSRIVFVSSIRGSLKFQPEQIRTRFTDPNLNLQQLAEIETEFLSAALAGKTEEHGFAESPYNISKTGVTTYCKLLARDYANDPRNIAFVSCHPGWVQTDMGGSDAPLTIDQGIQTPLYLTMLDYPSLYKENGKFFDLKQVAPF